MNSNEMRKNLEGDIQNLNGLILENKPNDDIAKLLYDISENVSKLNLMVMNEEFSVLRASDKPMYNAIMALEVSKVTLGQDKENGKYMLVDGKKIIDLAAFNRFCEPKKISNESGWVYRADNMARLLSAYATAELGGDWKELLNVYRLNKHTERTQEKNPVSKKTLTRELQSLVDAIIFIDNGKKENQIKVTSQDIAFMVLTACKAGKQPKTVVMPKGNTIIKLVVQVINRILKGDSYEVLYDRNK
mgnify:CR=1 FL=1